MAAALESPASESDWVEFCERHATAAAQDFSKSCVQYISRTLHESMRATLGHKEFLRKFVDCFSEQFEKDFCKRRLAQANSKVVNGTSNEEPNDVSDIEEGSPKMHHKHFLRRWKRSVCDVKRIASNLG